MQYLNLLQQRKQLCYYRIWTGPRIVSHGKRKIFLKNPSAGMPDLVLLPKGMPTIWAEIKRPSGRQSPEQVLFERNCIEMGHKYVILRSLEDIIAILEGIGIQPLVGRGLNEKASSGL